MFSDVKNSEKVKTLDETKEEKEEYEQISFDFTEIPPKNIERRTDNNEMPRHVFSSEKVSLVSEHVPEDKNEENGFLKIENEKTSIISDPQQQGRIKAFEKKDKLFETSVKKNREDSDFSEFIFGGQADNISGEMLEEDKEQSDDLNICTDNVTDEEDDINFLSEKHETNQKSASLHDSIINELREKSLYSSEYGENGENDEYVKKEINKARFKNYIKEENSKKLTETSDENDVYVSDVRNGGKVKSDESDGVSVSAVSGARQENIAFGIEPPPKEVDADNITILDAEGLKSEPENVSEADEKLCEYTSNSQNAEITKGYRDTQKSLIIRMVTVAFFSVILFFMENGAFFGYDVFEMFSISVNRLALADMMIVVLCMAMAPIKLIRVFSDIKQLRAKPELFVSITAILCIICDAVTTVFANDYIPMYGAVCGVGILLLLLSEYFRVKSRAGSFSIVSSPGDKLVCEISETTETEKEIVNDDRIIRIKKAGFVSGFIENSIAETFASRINFIILTAAFVLSVAIAVTGTVVSDTADICDSLSYFIISFLMMSPIFSVIESSYPFLCISNRTNDAGSTIIGERAIRKYSSAKNMIFEDVEAFPSSLTKVVKIKLVSDCELSNILYYVASLFRYVGGPLEYVFSIASVELGASDNVSLSESKEDGLSAVVDGVNICVGSKEYLRSLNVNVSDDDEDVRRTKTGPISILHAALNGRYCGKFYIQYSFDRNFARRVVALKKSGITTYLRTFDPGINDETVKKTTKLSGYGIKVIRKNISEVMDFGRPQINSTLVTKYTAAQLIGSVILCKKTRKLNFFFTFGKIAVPVISAVAFGILSYFSVLGSMCSIYAFIYHAYFALMIAIASNIYLK